MNRFLTTAICVGMLVALLAGVAGAGMNSGASARLYWLSGTSATAGLTTRNSTATPGTALVTLKGMASCRGVDLQIVVAALDGTHYPVCWQNGNYVPKPDGWKGTASTILPPLYATTLDGGKATPVTAKGGDMLFNDPNGYTPNQCGLIWYAVSAGVGKSRDVAKEYGVFGFQMTPDDGTVDPLSVPCHAVCISPNWRIGTGGYDTRNAVLVSDATNALDFVAFETGYRNLVYGDPTDFTLCPEVTTPASSNTWGKVKRMYR
jgi:hypothetical protein